MPIDYLARWIYTMRTSYWLVPSVMTLGAIILALLAIYLSVHYDTVVREVFGAWIVVRPDGARAILATIAGSMITVAGVTFSVTTLAVSNATANFGPRLSASFLKDRGSQVTLGTFVGTFVFCVVVLSIIAGGEEDQSFVPNIALLVAFSLALCSVAVLIFFTQHAQQSLYISTIVAELGAELEHRVGELFPRQIGERAPRPSDVDLPPIQARVTAAHSGYLQHITSARLFLVAREHECVIELLCAPGQFILAGSAVARIRRARQLEEGLDAPVRACIELGTERTPQQDVMFVVDQLSQVAVRALSPGVNDPFTANTCLDWLVNFLAQLGDRSEREAYRAEHGVLRVIARATRFEDAADHALDQIRPYACTNIITACHVVPMLKRLRSATQRTSFAPVIGEHVERWFATMARNEWDPSDRRKLLALIEDVDGE
jgi:uncharacterized membrane protein